MQVRADMGDSRVSLSDGFQPPVLTAEVSHWLWAIGARTTSSDRVCLVLAPQRSSGDVVAPELHDLLGARTVLR